MIQRVLVAVVAKYVCGKLVLQKVLVAVVAKYVCRKLVLQRVLVAVVAKYVCGKLVLQRVLVAVVAKYVCRKLVVEWVLVTVFPKVARLIGCRCYKGSKVSMSTFGYRKRSSLRWLQSMHVGNLLYKGYWLQWLQKLRD